MVSKHTEGPWYVGEPNNSDTAIHGIWTSDDWVIADTVNDTCLPEEEQTANAVLMATAPELLEALEGLAQCVFDGLVAGAPRFEDAMLEAQRVIAKAKGEGDE